MDWFYRQSLQGIAELVKLHDRQLPVQKQLSSSLSTHNQAAVTNTMLRPVQSMYAPKMSFIVIREQAVYN